MRWFIDVRTHYDSSVSLDDRNGALCRFIRTFQDTLLENDVDKELFEREIEEEVRKLDVRYANGKKLIFEKTDVNSLHKDTDSLWPVFYEFYDSDFLLAQVCVHPILNTYRPKGGEQ